VERLVHGIECCEGTEEDENKVRLASNVDSIKFSVADSGIGIKEED
jgi:signal transduction histidine kinase